MGSRADYHPSRSSHSTATQPEMPPIELSEIAPQVQSVYVTGSIQDMKLPFSQLLHYKERDPWPQRIHELTASTLLQTLSFLEMSEYVTFPIVTLPCLLKLHVNFRHWAETDCFANLTISAIEEIKAVADSGNLIANLTSLLARCEPRCLLQTLCIRTGSGDNGVLTSLLKLTPCLVSLDTSLPSPLDIRNLAGIERRIPLVPLLETC